MTLRANIVETAERIKVALAAPIAAYSNEHMSQQIDLWTSKDASSYVGMVLSVVDEKLRTRPFNLPLVRIRQWVAGATGPVVAQAIRDFFSGMDVHASLPDGTMLGLLSDSSETKFRVMLLERFNTLSDFLFATKGDSMAALVVPVMG